MLKTGKREKNKTEHIETIINALRNRNVVNYTPIG